MHATPNGRFDGHGHDLPEAPELHFGCELKVDKDYHFEVDNDENEPQLSLRTVSVGAGAKEELHVV